MLLQQGGRDSLRITAYEHFTVIFTHINTPGLPDLPASENPSLPPLIPTVRLMVRKPLPPELHLVDKSRPCF